MSKNFYLKKIIEKGDSGSVFLREQTQKTLNNSEFVQIINGIASVKIPSDYCAVVHSAAGDSQIENCEKYAQSLVENLVDQAKILGAIPIGFSNIIDSNSGDFALLESAIRGMIWGANTHKISILNGENAILGKRISDEIIVTGTMISMIPKADLGVDFPNILQHENIEYAIFDPAGDSIVINSDGVGTKMEFYERIGKPELAIRDLFAMNLDDAVKLHAKTRVISCVFEANNPVHNLQIAKSFQKLSKQMDIIGALHCETAGNRLCGYSNTAFNLNGSAVSTISENALHNLPKPKAGNFLVVIQGKPNPRSNGMTSRRSAIEILAKSWNKQTDWHLTKKGQYFLEYLATPSTIFYPLFSALLDSGLATAVFHLSGGAWNGKLAKPLAKENLFVSMDKIFQPDSRKIVLMEALEISARESYAQWHMGNECFVSTANPQNAIRAIQKFGFRAVCVGKLETAVAQKGIAFTAFDGEQIYFEGL